MSSRFPGRITSYNVCYTKLLRHPAATRVETQLWLRANPAAALSSHLRLDGRQLELRAIALDGVPLAAASYLHDDEGLTVYDVPDTFVLSTVVHIDPEANTALEGLYRASGIFCTQCEAQGFRKITFYPDRPDVMARFTVTLVADPTLCSYNFV